MGAELQRYEVRDSTLNGICSRGTISFTGVETISNEYNTSAECAWTMMAASCDLPPDLLLRVVSAGYQSARRSGLGFETSECRNATTGEPTEATSVMCRDYHTNQQVCIDAAVQRAKVSHIIGIVGLCLYPIFFWTRVFSFLSFAMPVAWGATLYFYQHREDECMFFILEKIATYVVFFAGGWMAVQITVLLAACYKGNSWQEMETYLRAKHGVATDEQAVQNWRPPLSSDDPSFLSDDGSSVEAASLLRDSQ